MTLVANGSLWVLKFESRRKNSCSKVFQFVMVMVMQFLWGKRWTTYMYIKNKNTFPPCSSVLQLFHCWISSSCFIESILFLTHGILLCWQTSVSLSVQHTRRLAVRNALLTLQQQHRCPQPQVWTAIFMQYSSKLSCIYHYVVRERWSCLPPACDRCMITNALSKKWCETLFPFRANS